MICSKCKVNKDKSVDKTYYLNKVDAEAELKKYVTKFLDENSEDKIKESGDKNLSTILKHYQKVSEFYNNNINLN